MVDVSKVQFLASHDRDLKIVRETAELASSGVAVSELFDRFCALLARFVDASVVFMSRVGTDGTYIEHVYDHGISRRDLHLRVDPNSSIQRVVDSGVSLAVRSLNEADSPALLPPIGGGESRSNSAAFVPLRFGSEIIGVLSVQSDRPDSYSGKELQLLETCALYVAVAVHADAIRGQKEHFENAASLDSLTNVLNRRYFDERLEGEWRRGSRSGSPLSVVMVDIDWFKAFNDTYGHLAGDACLKQVAGAAKACMTRDADTFFRYGGEEFAAVLPATDLTGALAVAERMRTSIGLLDIPHMGSANGKVTASFGVATCTAFGEGGPEGIVRSADRLLYAAKAFGRNCVVGDHLSEGSAHTQRRVSMGSLGNAATNFVGRKNELNEILALLRTERLVTLSGPPGVGKSRLAMSAAQRCIHSFHNVSGVDLGRISDANLLDAAVMAALDLSESSGVDARTKLLRDLSEQRALLLFDNCEHLREATAQLVEEILAAAPGVTILVTSREPLGAAREIIFSVEPLKLDDAVMLFEDRARNALPSFRVADDEREIVRTLCERLDRLPIAAELAAPRVKTMTLAEIVAGLDRRFHMLVADSRSADARQQALYTSIDWSFDLLEERAQRLFEKLSVFAGTVDGDGVREICSGKELEPWDVGPVLDGLIEKNLVVVERDSRGDRYRLLNSIREFAALKLEERGAESAAGSRHARYYCAFVRRAGEQLQAVRSEDVLDHVRREWPNVRAALQWAFDGAEAEIGRQIVLALARYWLEAGQFIEGAHWIDRALASGAPASAQERADLFHAAALAAYHQGAFVRLRDLAAELIELYRALDDRGGLAKAQNLRALALWQSGETEGVQALYHQVIENCHAAGDRRGAAVAFTSLAAFVANSRLDYTEARRLCQESLAILQELGFPTDVAHVLANLAELATYEGDFGAALTYSNESLAIFQRVGNQSQAAVVLISLGRCRLLQREYGAAVTALRDASAHLQGEPAPEKFANLFDVWFALACDAGGIFEAARLLGFVDEYRERHRVPRQKVDAAWFAPSVALLQGKLADNEALTLRNEGKSLTPSELDALIESVAAFAGERADSIAAPASLAS
jgi:diguanylate cyclase (GGDEF)-like protein